MQIGLHEVIPGAQLHGIVFIWDPHQFHGNKKSRQQYIVPLLRLNIIVWLLLYVNYNGLLICYMILTSMFSFQSILNVTVRLLSTFPKILCFIIKRTKYLEIDCYIVRDRYKDGFIRLIHVSTKDHIADILTKSLTHTVFHRLFYKSGLVQFTSAPTWRRGVGIIEWVLVV